MKSSVLGDLFPGNPYSLELQLSLEAVEKASRLCEEVWKVQSQTTILKTDNSPVTIADYAAQYTIIEAILQEFPNDTIIAEEDFSSLSPTQSTQLSKYIDLSKANSILRRKPEKEALHRFWTIDPIDGTLGYINNGQYSCCVALIVGEDVVLGALGCPRLETHLGRGTVFFAIRSLGAYMFCMEDDGSYCKLPWKGETSDVTLTESREKSHTDPSFSREFISKLKITEIIQMDSQCKYGIVAARNAHIYLRHSANKGYREKIWDHAPGSLVVEESGGKVTDLTGARLRFRPLRTIEVKGGIIVTNFRPIDRLTHGQILNTLEELEKH